MSTPDRDGDFRQDVIAGLERRFYAALIDMVAVSAGCLAVVQAGSVLVPVVVPAARGPALVLMGVMFVSEALTGRSIGKLVMRLRVEGLTGGRATILQTTVRAGARWFAPLVSLSSVLTRDMAIASLLAGGAMMLVIGEIPACYITLFRRGGTIFDLVARTRVGGARESGRT